MHLIMSFLQLPSPRVNFLMLCFPCIPTNVSAMIAITMAFINISGTYVVMTFSKNVVLGSIQVNSVQTRTWQTFLLFLKAMCKLVWTIDSRVVCNSILSYWMAVIWRAFSLYASCCCWGASTSKLLVDPMPLDYPLASSLACTISMSLPASSLASTLACTVSVSDVTISKTLDYGQCKTFLFHHNFITDVFAKI